MIAQAMLECGPSEVGAHIPDVMLRLSKILGDFNTLCGTINVCYVCKQPLDEDHVIYGDGSKTCSQCCHVPA